MAYVQYLNYWYYFIKLGYEQKLSSIIILKVIKDLETSFYYTILMLGLTVDLWVKSNQKFPLDIKKVAEWWLQLWNKYQFLIRNNKIEEAIILNSHIKNNFA